MRSRVGRSTGLIIRTAALIALGAAEAYAQAAPAGSADSFAAEYRRLAAEYRAVVDFGKPIAPTPALPTQASTGSGVSTIRPLTLEALLSLAGSGNPALDAASEAVAAAEADLAGARARRLPSLTAESSGTYIGNPLAPITLTAGQLGEYNGVPIPPEDVIIYEGMESSNYDFSLVGEVPLYTWGKIELGVALAKTGLGAAALQRSKAEREMALRLRGDWDALCYVVEASKVVDLQARIAERLVYLSERSEAAGFITRADLAGARIRLKEVDIAEARLDERRERLLSEMASMAGLRELSVADLALEPPAAGSASWGEAEAAERAKGGSYDLALLDALLESKRGLRDLREKEAKGLPDIGLRVELSYGGSRFPFVEKDWFGQDDWQLTFSLGTSGGLFSNPAKKGEAAKAGAELAEAESRKADAERSVGAYVRQSYLAVELGQAKLEYAALKQDGWEADLAQMSAAIGAGAGSESDYLSLMIEALGGLAEAYGTLAEYRSSLLSIEGAAGSRADR